MDNTNAIYTIHENEKDYYFYTKAAGAGCPGIHQQGGDQVGDRSTGFAGTEKRTGSADDVRLYDE